MSLRYLQARAATQSSFSVTYRKKISRMSFHHTLVQIIIVERPAIHRSAFGTFSMAGGDVSRKTQTTITPLKSVRNARAPRTASSPLGEVPLRILRSKQSKPITTRIAAMATEESSTSRTAFPKVFSQDSACLMNSRFCTREVHPRTMSWRRQNGAVNEAPTGSAEQQPLQRSLPRDLQRRGQQSLR